MARRRRLEGVDEVGRMFRDMTPALQRELTHAINTSVHEIAQMQRAIVPVGTEDEEHIRDDIHTDLVKTSRGVAGVVYAGTKDETRDAAYRTEFGRAKGGAGTEGHSGTDPDPWFYLSLSALSKRARRRIARAMRAGASAVVRRHGGR